MLCVAVNLRIYENTPGKMALTHCETFLCGLLKRCSRDTWRSEKAVRNAVHLDKPRPTNDLIEVTPLEVSGNGRGTDLSSPERRPDII